ncbi:MAG: DUF488 domain-containing protein [Vulcanimicrobiaceae bacterium]
MGGGTAIVGIKRAYDQPAASDGYRVLVERLWPRGLRRGQAAIDLWLKEIAPSTELRQWYAHDVERWPEFKRRYQAELRRNSAGVRALLECCRSDTPVTFVYAAHDQEHNSAVVLRDFVQGRTRAAARPARKARA